MRMILSMSINISEDTNTDMDTDTEIDMALPMDVDMRTKLLLRSCAGRGAEIGLTTGGCSSEPADPQRRAAFFTPTEPRRTWFGLAMCQECSKMRACVAVSIRPFAS